MAMLLFLKWNSCFGLSILRDVYVIYNISGLFLIKGFTSLIAISLFFPSNLLLCWRKRLHRMTNNLVVFYIFLALFLCFIEIVTPLSIYLIYTLNKCFRFRRSIFFLLLHWLIIRWTLYIGYWPIFIWQAFIA